MAGRDSCPLNETLHFRQARLLALTLFCLINTRSVSITKLILLQISIRSVINLTSRNVLF